MIIEITKFWKLGGFGFNTSAAKSSTGSEICFFFNIKDKKKQRKTKKKMGERHQRYLWYDGSRVAEDRHRFRKDIWAAMSWRYALRRRKIIYFEYTVLGAIHVMCYVTRQGGFADQRYECVWSNIIRVMR